MLTKLSLFETCCQPCVKFDIRDRALYALPTHRHATATPAMPPTTDDHNHDHGHPEGDNGYRLRYDNIYAPNRSMDNRDVYANSNGYHNPGGYDERYHEPYAAGGGGFFDRRGSPPGRGAPVRWASHPQHGDRGEPPGGAKRARREPTPMECCWFLVERASQSMTSVSVVCDMSDMSDITKPAGGGVFVVLETGGCRRLQVRYTQ